MTQQSNHPIQPKERIIALDFLRGFALLGILLMNIQSFAMPSPAYFNPTAFGDLTGINLGVWTFSHVFADSKFMTIFSILYGAGIILITQKAEEKGTRPGRLHYSRTFWLLVIGLFHAYVLWYGDILVLYAVTAFIIFLFRKLSPRWLLIWGTITLIIGSLLTLGLGVNYDFFPPEVQAEFVTAWSPSTAEIAKEVDAFQGGWLQQMEVRATKSLDTQTSGFFFWGFWRAGGLMLLGMGLFKMGVLTAQRSKAFYRNMLLIGFATGFPLIIVGLVTSFNSGWSLEYARFAGSLFNYLGSIGVSLGYISAIMLIAQSGRGQAIVARFAAVGRMALSNYLLQTVLSIFVFYGFGLGLFGQVERIGQLLVVLGIWAIQLIVSPIWLRHYRFGPVEWLWRSLTYGKAQPMAIKP